MKVKNPFIGLLIIIGSIALTYFIIKWVGESNLPYWLKLYLITH